MSKHIYSSSEAPVDPSRGRLLAGQDGLNAWHPLLAGEHSHWIVMDCTVFPLLQHSTLGGIAVLLESQMADVYQLIG